MRTIDKGDVTKVAKSVYSDHWNNKKMFHIIVKGDGGSLEIGANSFIRYLCS